jgi:hypothetical protein
MNDKEEFFNNLDELRTAYDEGRKMYEDENDSWWNGLTEKEREDAFYAVCKRIYQTDVKDRGTYRWALYEVFGFDMGMYGRGMDCGYMDIHNCLFDGEELAKMKSVNRFEVIDDTGRTYTKYLKDDEGIKYSLQDDDKTLKVFIDKLRWKEDL